MPESGETDEAETSRVPAPKSPRKSGNGRLRERLALGIGLAVGALGGRLFVGEPAGDGRGGIARALGAAVRGTVSEDGFVWEASGGILADSIWGRNILFSARISGPDGPQNDVFRASVRTSYEGRALGVFSVANVTQTRLADEATLEVHDRKLTLLSRRGGKVSGVTVVDLESECAGCSPMRRSITALGRRLAPTEGGPWARYFLTFGTAPTAAQVQWFEGGLEVRTELGGLRYELARERLLVAPGASVEAKAWSIPAFLPRLFTKISENTHLVTKPIRLQGLDDGVPALATSELQTPLGKTLQLATIDTRQLDFHLKGGRLRPHSETGPGAMGTIPESDRERLVAILKLRPFEDGLGGFVEDGRTLIPPGERPTIGLLNSGELGFGHSASALEHLAIRSLVQSEPPPNAPGRLGALCRTSEGQVVFASGTSTPADLTEALGERCDNLVLFEAYETALVTDSGELAKRVPSEDAFFYLTRHETTPHLTDTVTFAPADGKGPDPAWLPALHHTKIERYQNAMELFAIDTTRYEWRVLAGKSEARGQTCESALGPADEGRLLLAIGLGASDAENPRGLAIAGASVKSFRLDHGVLLTAPGRSAARPSEARATPTPALTLALSVDGLTTADDAAELVLLAEAGVLRSEARTLGAPKLRSAMCMPRPELLLYAEGQADSPEPLAEELRALGCRRIVSSDRGRQNTASFYRAGSASSGAIDPGEVTLVGLAIETRGRSRLLGP